MAVGAGCEDDGGAGGDVVAGERDGCEDELAAAVCDETGKASTGVGSAEFDDVEVARELLPGVGKDASAGVCLVAGVFSAICTGLAVCDEPLCGLGDGGGCGRVGREESLRLFETPFGGCKVPSEGVGFAVAGGEELSELSIGLDCAVGWW